MHHIPQETIDRHLQSILKASGSELKNYTMPSTLHNMRNAMRIAIEEGVTIGRRASEHDNCQHIDKD